MVDPATKALLQVARDVLPEFDVDEVLGRALSSAQTLTGARYAALGVLDASGGKLARFLTAGMDEQEKLRIGPLPTGHGVLGELIRNPEPLRLPDVSSHHRAYGFPAGHPQMRSFLGVPILIGGRAYGNLYLTEKEGAEEFTEADEEAMVLLAEFAGLAIDHARRFGRSEESRRRALEKNVAALDATARRRDRIAAGEAERSRWARELHDETLQGLAALRMSLAAMEGAEPAAAQRLIEQAIGDVETEIEKLQALITDLRPVALDQLGVAAAIEALASRLELPELEIRTRIDLAFEAGRAEERLDGEMEIALYRVVQEALTNTIKHAGAARAFVEVVEHDDRGEVRVAVEDDGDGFDPDAHSPGFGLNGMRERVELLGGSIEIRSSGEGTGIEVSLPSRREGTSAQVA